MITASGVEISAVIFDMDGLMLDTERINQSTWKRALIDSGYAVEEDFYLDIFGRPISQAETLLKRTYGEDFPFYDVRKIKQAYFDETIQQFGYHVKPGLIELLDYLQEQDIYKGVASSTHRDTVISRLAQTNLLERFDTIAGGDEVTHGKPAPDLFLLVAKRLGVPPELCMVLEDSEPGLEASNKAGMMAFMVPDIKQPSERIKTLILGVLPSLHDVKDFLQGNTHKREC